MLPLPKIKFFNGFGVIDDSEVWSKYRYLEPEISETKLKHIFALATGWGASENLLTQICKEQDKQLHLIYPRIPGGSHSIAKRNAELNGVHIIPLNTDDLREAKAFALQKAERTDGKLISLSNEKLSRSYIDTARRLDIDPDVICTASTSGTLCRSLQIVWSRARHETMVVLKVEHADMGSANIHYSDQDLSEESAIDPPFPCNRNFEGKMWQRMLETEKPSKNTFLWNSAGPN